MVCFDPPDDPIAAPSSWVKRFAPRISEGGTVLDLACGRGRHTRYLNELGHDVVAVDLDVSGLSDLMSRESVEVIEADLELGDWPLGERRFEGIVVTNYLHRPLLPRLVESLAADGVLIYETFAVGQEKLGRPHDSAFLLEPGELLHAFTPQLVVVAYEHVTEVEPRPAVRQRICGLTSDAFARAQPRDSAPTPANGR